jgi:hypothetical protein
VGLRCVACIASLYALPLNLCMNESSGCWQPLGQARWEGCTTAALRHDCPSQRRSRRPHRSPSSLFARLQPSSG